MKSREGDRSSSRETSASIPPLVTGTRPRRRGHVFVECTIPLSATDAAIHIGLDGQRGAAWLERMSEAGLMRHVRYRGATLFVPSDVHESLAMLWWRSGHVGSDYRSRAIKARVQSSLAHFANRIASASPAMRLAEAVIFVGHPDASVRPCHRMDAEGLGWSSEIAEWPTHIDPDAVEWTAARRLWVRMTARERMRCVRLLAGENKGAASEAH